MFQPLSITSCQHKQQLFTSALYTKKAKTILTCVSKYSERLFFTYCMVLLRECTVFYTLRTILRQSCVVFCRIFGFAICGLLMRICTLTFCGLAQLRNVRICNSGNEPTKFAPLRSEDFFKLLSHHFCRLEHERPPRHFISTVNQQALAFSIITFV